MFGSLLRNHDYLYHELIPFLLSSPQSIAFPIPFLIKFSIYMEFILRKRLLEGNNYRFITSHKSIKIVLILIQRHL